MAKSTKKRRPFDLEDRAEPPQPTRRTSGFDDGPNAVFRFFQNYGVRETLESVIVAVVLAMLFRTFGGEAYIIPTGSMAPSLQGQHMDVTCDKCQARYLTGSSEDNPTIPENDRMKVLETNCPFCRAPMTMRPRANAEHQSNSGDRIVVNKFIYDFQQPKRFDVIVFKNPNNGKQNYIKRLIGLPGEKLKIENGDIYTMTSDGAQGWRQAIVRKPAYKLMTMKHPVDDTDFIAPLLHDAKWPLRWNEWANPDDSKWNTVVQNHRPIYSISSDETSKKWLRYRHLVPNKQIWERIEDGESFENYAATHPGELIGDWYCYNERTVGGKKGYRETFENGLHWVGDLGLEVDLEIKSSSGKLFLDVVEAGVHFELEIDVATGEGNVTNDGSIKFHAEDGSNPLDVATCQTPLTGPGKYSLLFFNADDQIRLWVNNREMKFDVDCYSPSHELLPRWSPNDPGDAEPLGIAATGLALTVNRLRVWRDQYYTSVKGETIGHATSRNETGYQAASIREVLRNPDKWDSSSGQQLFQARFRNGGPMFELGAQQFLPMGDNSPESLDARIWQGEHFVPGELMIGRALYIFWPAPKRTPVPFWPNFERMGPIR